MSNLSDLLPAGAAAKQLTFTDSGSGITTKKPVVLNSDGTVSEVIGSTQSIGTESVFESATVYDTGIAYDSNENKVVVAYKDGGNSNYGTAIVGTISGTSVSFTGSNSHRPLSTPKLIISTTPFSIAFLIAKVTGSFLA